MIDNEHHAITLAELSRAVGDLIVRLDGPPDLRVIGISADSTAVRPGDLFVCVPGAVSDGHLFVADASAAGAAALCVERPVDSSLPALVVTDSRRAMGRLAAALFGHPAGGLTLLGVTGTNGKTTTTFLLEAILAASGRTTGLIGTIETRLAGVARPGVRTTPDAVDLQSLFYEMRTAGVDAVAMEVTSHALALHRVEGVIFDAVAFTNLSQDHLDFHPDMESYFLAKRSLFTPARARAGAVNVDDPYGRKLLDEAEIPCVGFGVGADATVRAENIRVGNWGTEFVAVAPDGEIKVTTALVGDFNVYNCLAAVATALRAGIDPGAIERGIADLHSVPGRFESIDQGQPFAVIVDYAHTPDSLDNVLRAARRVAERSGGRVLCAFGCGGDRDKGKRPLMGAVVARAADVVVVTSDNPRSEDPQAIIDAILEGVVAERAEGADAVHVDRRAAIEEVIGTARPGDVVVIAGKGHEAGQEFRDVVLPFDDRAVARSTLGALGWGTKE